MASKVSANAHPWIDDWNLLTSNSYASLSYNYNAQSYLCRGGCCNTDNAGNLMHDVTAAYQLALRWKISGITSYADKAVAIMNAWSSTLTGIGCTNSASSNDFRLLAGIQGYQFANVGEIMRSYSGLSASNFAAFQTMMRNIFYPINNLDVAKDGLDVYSSWELCSTASIMAIGVLTDNQTMFNEALGYFKTGLGNGAVAQTIYYIHPGYLGQTQEAGRDQAHNTLSMALLGVIAEQAWNQGVDLYGYGNNHFLMGAEYVAKGNLIQSGSTYYTVPFAPYVVNNWAILINDTKFSADYQGTIRPSWASIYNHYVNRKGLAAPYTSKMMNLIAPDGGGGNYGPNSGGFDQLGFQTLTYTRDPISSGVPPSGLTAYLTNNNVVLSWWGSAYATSYVVQRGTSSGGPYTTLSSGITDPLTYTDLGPGASTYYYVVKANSSSTTASNEVKVITNAQTLSTYLKFDESSGSSASDSSGNGYSGTLVGTTIWVSGKINNGILLWGGYVTLPSGIVSGLSDFTICAWVYLNARSAGVRLFDFGFGTDRWMMFTAQASNGNAGFGISATDIGGIQAIYGSSPLPTGQWVHVAVTLLGKVGTYYLNGAQAGTNNNIWLSPFQLAGATDLAAQNYIGKSQYSSDPNLNGTIDDFRIYYGALTASQISSLYSSQNG